MKARLVAAARLPGRSPALTTRDADDPAIALLDAWATVADVLTFYQERIANEGYLRTATERRSVLELARLIGYRSGPASRPASTWRSHWKTATMPGSPGDARAECAVHPADGQAYRSCPRRTRRPSRSRVTSG